MKSQDERAAGLVERMRIAIADFETQVAELEGDPTLVDSIRWVEYTEQIGYYMSGLSDEFCADLDNDPTFGEEE
jgi:hypothetical protein